MICPQSWGIIYKTKENGKETNMSYYAVTLEFDQESESKMQEMIEEVARVTGCDQLLGAPCRNCFKADTGCFR